MAPRHYNIADQKLQSLKRPHLERSRGRQTPSQPMPKLPPPFIRNGDCHYTLIHDDVTATLKYDRQCGLWEIRFDWPGIIVGSYNQFPRDIPATEMRNLIVLAIEARWGDDNWMTDDLPTCDVPGQDSSPACYGIGRGEY